MPNQEDAAKSAAPFSLFSFGRSLMSFPILGRWERLEPNFFAFFSLDEPWKVEDRGEKPAIALKGR
jgi:hypothetical protein